jgi:tetratricopeptide (TPR) repeat protein
MSDETGFNLNEAHTHFAKAIFNHIWDLLGEENRTIEQDEEMIYAAHASAYHWLKVGTGLNHQRAEWMISHVYAVLGLGEAALRHAERCLKLTDEHRALLSDFDFAYVNEALARAYAALGDQENAHKYYQTAKRTGQEIANNEDRKWFMSDLQSGEWYSAI